MVFFGVYLIYFFLGGYLIFFTGSPPLPAPFKLNAT